MTTRIQRKPSRIVTPADAARLTVLAASLDKSELAAKRLRLKVQAFIDQGVVTVGRDRTFQESLPAFIAAGSAASSAALQFQWTKP